VDFLRETHPQAAISVLDDLHPNGPGELDGCPVVGRLEDARALAAAGAKIALGIANSRQLGLRSEIALRLALREDAWLTYVHPAATVSASASVGHGCVVYPGARIATHARVEPFALVYYNAVVHHDDVIGEAAVVCAGVLLAGGVVVGDGAYLGIGCAVREGVRIGRRALVGMGAVVTRDVADGERVAGVPARALAGRTQVPPPNE
jgi:sugar O-acyltransferase (sialic acid O-acetyltransferase NeuD family)